MIYTYFLFFPTSKLTGGYPISTATVLDGLDGQNLRAFSALSMRLTISTPSCELGCQSLSEAMAHRIDDKNHDLPIENGDFPVCYVK